MNRTNLIYAQLSEAIRLASNEIFDYKRISLILLDNIIENLLRTQVLISARHEKVMSQISKEKYEEILKSLGEFDKIIKYSSFLKIIDSKSQPLLNFCHKRRNNVYHHFYEDTRVTDCCIQMLNEFIYKNLERLMEIGISEYSEESKKNHELILQISSTDSYHSILTNLNNLFLQNDSPSKILSSILNSQIEEIENFWESSTNEDWEKFNKIIRTQYFWDKEYKEEKNQNENIDLLIHNFQKKWRNINKDFIDDIKKKAATFVKLPTVYAFEKYQLINSKIEPIYFGMRMYIAKQEEIYFNSE